METPLLNISDILIDPINKEVGVLLRRYNLYDHFPYNDETFGLEETFECVTIVWDIFWCGPELWPNEHMQAYTEEGLFLLMESGVLKLYKNI